MKKCKLLLFDLDGTLLQSDKTISTRTLSALKKCRGNDILIGVSTSRSEQNSLVFLNELMPDILISSGGALVKYKTEYIYRAEFSEEETNVMIDTLLCIFLDFRDLPVRKFFLFVKVCRVDQNLLMN